MRAQKERLRWLLTRIIDDPWRKLLAIGLAVLLWFFIDNQITRTIRRSLPLVPIPAQGSAGAAMDRLAIALPLDRVVPVRFHDGQRAIDRVEVVLTGPRYRIAAFENDDQRRLDLQITKFLGLDWSESTSVVFTADDIARGQRGLEDVRFQLEPPRIRLDVMQMDEWQVPITLGIVDLKEDGLSGRLRLSTTTFAPETATVQGPASGLDRLRKSGRVFRATVKALGNERQVTADLQLIDGVELGLSLRERVTMTIQVEPQTKRFTCELPVVVDDLALPPEWRGRYQPDVKTKVVDIRVGGELLSHLTNLETDKQKQAEFAASVLRLSVHVQKPEPGQQYPPDMTVAARLRLVGRLADTVDRSEYLLDDTIPIKLRR